VVDPVVAALAGFVQGIFEWLPVSSEGNVTILLTALGHAPDAAVALSLFLHVGTALAATVYYRDRLTTVGRSAVGWRLGDPFAADTADLSFLVVGTLASGVTGIAAYAALDAVVSALTGGLFVAAIGVALVATGLLQRFAASLSLGTRATPTLLDAVLTGGLQGFAILPGVSRSGVTVSALLLRRHDGRSAFDRSFLLSIPAALGAGALVVLDTGGLPSVTPAVALLALTISAVVGYLTIDALLRLVARIPVWVVCTALGLLAVGGGVLASTL
jgi:undecaprenyl-diphosphatase